MTTLTRSQIANQIAAELGHGFDGEIRIGGHYVSAVRDGRTVYISGQVPRVGSTVMVTGRVGEQVSLDEARKAAQICALRALAILRQTLGSLDAIEKILRIGVFVQCTADFTQQSEVADAASRSDAPCLRRGRRAHPHLRRRLRPAEECGRGTGHDRRRARCTLERDPANEESRCVHE